MAIAVDNLADADSLTTIEKEEGEEAAGENEEGQEQAPDEQETGNLSRTGSKSSRRKSKVTVDEATDVESGHLHKTYSVMSHRSRKGQVSTFPYKKKPQAVLLPLVYCILG